MEAGALLKQFVAENGEGRIFECSAEFVELGNKFVKANAHKGNWVRNPERRLQAATFKRGSEFKDKWRTNAFQMFVVDYVCKIEALRLGILN